MRRDKHCIVASTNARQEVSGRRTLYGQETLGRETEREPSVSVCRRREEVNRTYDDRSACSLEDLLGRCYHSRVSPSFITRRKSTQQDFKEE